MIKLLAWQRIQQLFPPKVPSPQTSISPPAAPKTPPVLPDSETPAARSTPALPSVSEGADLKLTLSFAGQKKVQARAVFYPLTGKGQAVNMCYRTLYIGSGKPPQFNASFLTCTNVFGHAIAGAPANGTLPTPPPQKVLTWTCALPITVIATTYPGNTPAFSTMRYVAVSVVVTLAQGVWG